MTDGIDGTKKLMVLSMLLAILEYKITTVFLYRKTSIKSLKKQQANMFT